MVTGYCRRAEGDLAAPCTCGMCTAALRDALAAARELVDSGLTGPEWWARGEEMIGQTVARRDHAMREIAAAGLDLLAATSVLPAPSGSHFVPGWAVNAYRATLLRVVGADTEEADHA